MLSKQRQLWFDHKNISAGQNVTNKSILPICFFFRKRYFVSEVYILLMKEFILLNFLSTVLILLNIKSNDRTHNNIPGLVCQLSPPMNIFLKKKRKHFT